VVVARKGRKGRPRDSYGRPGQRSGGVIASLAVMGLEAAKTSATMGLKEPIKLRQILPRSMTLELFEEVANGVALRCALEQLIDAHADPKESDATQIQCL
jgi:hypothetical protein